MRFLIWVFSFHLLLASKTGINLLWRSHSRPLNNCAPKLSKAFGTRSLWMVWTLFTASIVGCGGGNEVSNKSTSSLAPVGAPSTIALSGTVGPMRLATCRRETFG
jgi:hypothetical protein